MRIHPTALISDDTQLADDVVVGPYAIIDGPAVIGTGCVIGPRASISGRVTMGTGNTIGPGTIIGGPPQDLSYDPSIKSGVIMGNNNSTYEYVTIHRSASEGENTVIGNDNFLMTGCHFAHDCQVGNDNVVANNALFAGHATLGNHTVIGGGAGFHQFIRIGDYALAQGNSGISKDVPPFCIVHKLNRLSGLNIIGLRRAGFTGEQRKNLKAVYAALFQNELSREEAIEFAETKATEGPGMDLIAAVKNPSRKGVLTR